MVMIAVTTQAARYSAGESVPRAMSQSTRKMPLPIIDPTTRVVALNRPRLCTICGPGPVLEEFITVLRLPCRCDFLFLVFAA